MNEDISLADKKDSKPRALFKFGNIAMILGFTVDIITLTSIIVSLQLPEITKNLPTYISPGLALSLWVLTVYGYLSFLYFFWQRNASIKEFSNKFSVFLIKDLFFNFREPLILFPIVLFVILFFWILYSISLEVLMGFSIILAFAMLILVPLIGMFLDSDKGNLSNIPQSFKDRVVNEWKLLSDQINTHFLNHMWMNDYHLATIAAVWGGTN
jgi:hypothetical protein